MRWPELVLPLALLALGLLALTKPDVLWTWIREPYPEHEAGDRDVKRTMHATSAVLIMAGLVLFLLDTTAGKSPTLRDCLAGLFSLFWIGWGLYVVLDPAGALEHTQYPWTRLPVWVIRTLGAVISLTGFVVLAAYMSHQP